MSINVALDQLRTEIARYGHTPYLLSQGDDGRPHAVAVTVTWEGERLVSSSGTRSARNVAAHPLVSLLWPPVEPGGYSLIVDGDGAVSGEGAGARITITPTRGVLHRPGSSPVSQARGCGADCVPLL